MRRLLLISLLVGVVSASTAHADTITFTFQGTFQFWSQAPGITGADPYSGTFVYDSSATLVQSGVFVDFLNPMGVAYAVWASALTSITVTVNGVTYIGVQPHYTTFDDRVFGMGTEFPPDTYDLLFVEANFTPPWKPGGYTQMILGFGASSANVFDPQAWALPNSFAGFDVIDFALNGDTDDGSAGHAEGLVSSFQPVPEPATLLLLGAGLVGAVARRRHR